VRANDAAQAPPTDWRKQKCVALLRAGLIRLGICPHCVIVENNFLTKKQGDDTRTRESQEQAGVKERFAPRIGSIEVVRHTQRKEKRYKDGLADGELHTSRLRVDSAPDEDERE